ncbi:unnamed protein product [Nezara viridula]|uniref:Uncharacterized protein n=1 Tax=Nezara viridula TaxID=85310 RepID=A0A9P0H172_NEZVI|nr:unnamed protein product [Nezara viridula]
MKGANYADNIPHPMFLPINGEGWLGRARDVECSLGYIMHGIVIRLAVKGPGGHENPWRYESQSRHWRGSGLVLISQADVINKRLDHQGGDLPSKRPRGLSFIPILMQIIFILHL